MKPRTWRDAGWRDSVAIFYSRLLILAGVLSFLGIVVRHNAVLEIGMDVLGWVNVPSEPSLIVACLCFVLSGGLRRRFRPAHTVLSVLMVLSALSAIVMAIFGPNGPLATSHLRIHGVYGEWLFFSSHPVVRWVVVAVSLLSLGIVLAARPAFRARLSDGSRLAAVITMALGWFASFLTALLLLTLFVRHVPHTGDRVRMALRSSVGVRFQPGTPGVEFVRVPHWIFDIASTMTAIAFIVALLVLWRSGRVAGLQSANDELQLRSLLHKFGDGDSLGYFATRRDKSVIFSSDRQAAVTFRNQGSVSVASADPVGDPASWTDAIAAWLHHCADHGLYPAVLSASSYGAKSYVHAGLKAFNLGDEAIIDVDTFTLRGAAMRPVRQAVTRVERAGYTAVVRRHDELSQDELAEIARLADQWRGSENERGFSMALNRLADPSDGRCVLVTAHDQHGAIRGLLSFVPWGNRGLSLDLMRRDPACENGLNEYLVSHLVEAAPALGVQHVSMNFAVFRNVFVSAQEVGAGPITRLSDRLLSFASKFWQLETLYRANEKYRPRWVPRYLCYDAQLTVPRAAWAMGVAEGFIPSFGPSALVGPRRPDVQAAGRDAAFVQQVHVLQERARTVEVCEPRLSQQQRVRRAKLDEMTRQGFEPYPVSVPRTHTIDQIVAEYAGTNLGADVRTGNKVCLTGRVRALRDLGGVAFAVLEDGDSRIQVMATQSETCRAELARWKKWTDLGDIVSVTGQMATSHSGELSVLMHSWQMAAKCLSPIPHLHAQFRDPDARVRNRSLDLIVNADSRDMLLRRSRGVRAFRNAFDALGYAEVETPMLQTVHGGASARPFKTHINAYSTDLVLRIAPELYLKRLAVGGMHKVFELNRNFRNEGADATHNPEFTSLEAYDAYGDYNTMRVLTRQVLLEVATAVNGAPVALRPDAEGNVQRIDLSGEWPTVTVHEAVSKAVGVKLTSASTRAEVAAVCARHDVPAPREMSAGELIVELYDEFVEKQTTFPTFYTDFPVETSPLTRTHRSDPKLSERWDLVAFGAEIGTAYSELVDPVEQRRRLTEQSLKAAAGDVEAMSLDESFLAALEYAMPPTGGLGIGVDRTIMMLLGAPIRATLAFPFVRPQA